MILLPLVFPVRSQGKNLYTILGEKKGWRKNGFNSHFFQTGNKKHPERNREFFFKSCNIWFAIMLIHLKCSFLCFLFFPLRRLKIFSYYGWIGQLTLWINYQWISNFLKEKREKCRKCKTKHFTLWKCLPSLHCQWKIKRVGQTSRHPNLFSFIAKSSWNSC